MSFFSCLDYLSLTVRSFRFFFFRAPVTNHSLFSVLVEVLRLLSYTKSFSISSNIHFHPPTPIHWRIRSFSFFQALNSYCVFSSPTCRPTLSITCKISPTNVFGPFLSTWTCPRFVRRAKSTNSFVWFRIQTVSGNRTPYQSSRETCHLWLFLLLVIASFSIKSVRPRLLTALYLKTVFALFYSSLTVCLFVKPLWLYPSHTSSEMVVSYDHD